MKARTRAGRRPSLGQHFLQDEGWRRRVLDQLAPGARDTWLEIGAGHGEFTQALAETSRAVAAVERDPRLAAGLREQLGGLSGVRVIEADILTLDLEAVAREPAPPTAGLGGVKLRVFGSLPYYITSPILRRLFEWLPVIDDIHTIVQREVAERLVAEPGGRDYGYLSVLTQFYTEPELLLKVPRGAFRPVPKVDSALVRLTPPGASTKLKIRAQEEFVKFLGACFRQKRKTLRNNLRALYGATRVERGLVAAGFSERARAEELSVEKLAGLYDYLVPPAAGLAARGK